MTDYLRESLSARRFSTYEALSARLEEKRTPEQLYKLNVVYSKELYVLLGALEVAVRNSFHNALKKHFCKEDWFGSGILGQKHREQVDQAIDKLVRYKSGSYVLDDVVAQLNFGFWVHLCDRPYEKTLWIKGLYKCFPYLGEKPNRGDMERRLNGALRLRNKIAHLEPLIKYEDTLIQEYRNASQLLYAINPKTHDWFMEICKFQDVWNNRHD